MSFPFSLPDEPQVKIPSKTDSLPEKKPTPSLTPSASKASDMIIHLINSNGSIEERRYPRAVFNEKLKKWLVNGRTNLPPEIIKIHETVLKALTQVTKSTEINELIDIGKNLDGLLTEINQLLEIQKKEPLSEPDQKRLSEIFTKLSKTEKDLGDAPLSSKADLLTARGLIRDQVREIQSKIAHLLPAHNLSAIQLKGKISTQARSAIIGLASRAMPLVPKTGNAQWVVIRDGLVLKKGKKGGRAAEDENLAAALTSFDLPEGFVNFVKINEVSTLSFDYRTSPKEVALAQKRGYSIEDLSKRSSSPKLRDAIFQNMYDEGSIELAQKSYRHLTNFNKINTNKYEYLDDNGEWREVSLVQLINLNRSDQIDEDTTIRIKSDDPLKPSVEAPLEAYTKAHADFDEAFYSTDPLIIKILKQATLNTKQTVELYFEPDFSLDKIQKKLSAANMQVFINGKWKTTNLAHLQELWTRGLINKDTPIRKTSKTVLLKSLTEADIKGSTITFFEPTSRTWQIADAAFINSHSRSDIKVCKIEQQTTIESTNVLASVLDNLDMKKLYEENEKIKWEYQNAEGNWEQVNLKTLQALWLQQLIGPETQVRKEGDVTSAKTIASTPNGLKAVLNITWKLPQTDVYEQTTAEIIPISGVNAKPFVDMVLVSELSTKHIEYLNFILERISPESELALMITGELQYTDLHHENVGIQTPFTASKYESISKLLATDPNYFNDPTLKNDYEQLKTATFSYRTATKTGDSAANNVNFDEFIEDFRAGLIFDVSLRMSLGSKINVDFNTEITNPKLIEALHLGILEAVELVFFDNDHNMADSNLLGLRNYNYQSETGGVEAQTQIESSLPIRSVFLGTSLKDKPLTAQTIKTLTDPNRRKKREDWIRKTDAPIRQILPKDQQKIDEHLEALMIKKKYSLSHWKKTMSRDIVTVAYVQDLFANDMSKYTSENAALWQEVETQLEIKEQELNKKGLGGLLSYKIKKEDLIEVIENESDLKEGLGITPKKTIERKRSPEEVLEIIAQKKGLTVAELKKLNGGTITSITENNFLRIKPHLTEKSPEADKLRKKIAAQLFPRITVRQKKAYFERMDQESAFLRNYAHIDQTVIGTDEKSITDALNLFKSFVSSTSSPLTSARRAKLTKDLGEIEKELSEKALRGAGLESIQKNLIAFQAVLKKDTTPTYGNVLRVEYPLLADTEMVMGYLTQNKLVRGKAIGNYQIPLEMIVEAGLETPPEHYANRCAKFLKRRIEESKKGSTIFGKSFIKHTRKAAYEIFKEKLV